jgi:membrane associated rhomboid family serine protease
LYPNARVLGLLVIFPVRVSAWFFLGAWFIYQLVEANVGLLSTAQGDSGGVAFFAHVGGFVFGYVVGRVVRATASRSPSPSDPAISP